MISPSTIREIMDTARIEEVIGEFVNLKKSGANFKALSPWTNEKTPSFVISPSKQIFKDFSSGKGGTVVTFLMEHEQMTYPEALRWLAQKYNIELEESGSEDAAKEQEARNLRESLFIVNQFAQKHFEHNLFDTEEGQTIALPYFKERGYNEDTIRKFQLGYAMQQGDALTKAAMDKGHRLELLQQAGLTSSKGQRDFFRGRVQFTIHNYSGKIVGFAGRSLTNDKKSPKYINTPESDVYNKSQVLYGLHLAKNAVRKADECLLVEGYTDVISMVQAGIENVAASSGTALTQGQIRLIRRLTNNITILYDGDEAGIKAALRGVDLILEEDMNVKVVLLPEGEDPDSYVKSVGATDFRAYVDEKAQDFILFKAGVLQKDAGNDPVARANAIKGITETISRIPDMIKRQVYIRECSDKFDMEEQVLITEVNKLRRKKLLKENRISQREAEDMAGKEAAEAGDDTPPQEGIKKPLSLDLQEKDTIRLMLEHGTDEIEPEVTIIHAVLDELDGYEVENPQFSKAFEAYRKAFHDGKLLEASYFINHEDPELRDLAVDILQSPYEISENWSKMHDIYITKKEMLYEKDFNSSLTRLKLKLIQRNLKRLHEQIKTAETEEAVKELLEQKVAYEQAKVDLAKTLGTVILS